MSGTSARASDCSRRKPVIHANCPASARAKGSILRMWQQALRSAMVLYMASWPSRLTNSTTEVGLGSNTSRCRPGQDCTWFRSCRVSGCSCPVCSTNTFMGSWCWAIRWVMTMSSAPRLLAWLTCTREAAWRNTLRLCDSLALKVAVARACSCVAGVMWRWQSGAACARRRLGKSWRTGPAGAER